MSATDRTITMFFITLLIAFVITAIMSTVNPAPWSPVGEHNEKAKVSTAPVSPGQAV